MTTAKVKATEAYLPTGAKAWRVKVEVTDADGDVEVRDLRVTVADVRAERMSADADKDCARWLAVERVQRALATGRAQEDV